MISSQSCCYFSNSFFSLGKFHCPVTYRVFTESTHIVAVRTTGNVFSYDAVERLNLKAKNFRELLTDEPFTKADIIHLQVRQKFLIIHAFYSTNRIQITWINLIWPIFII